MNKQIHIFQFVIEVFQHLSDEKHTMNQVKSKFNSSFRSGSITDIISIQEVDLNSTNEGFFYIEFVKSN